MFLDQGLGLFILPLPYSDGFLDIEEQNKCLLNLTDCQSHTQKLLKSHDSINSSDLEKWYIFLIAVVLKFVSLSLLAIFDPVIA